MSVPSSLTGLWSFAKSRLWIKIILMFSVMMILFIYPMWRYIDAHCAYLRQSEEEHLAGSGRETIRSLSSNINIVYGLMSWDQPSIDAEIDASYSDRKLAYLFIYNEYSKIAYSRFASGLSSGDFELPPPDAQTKDAGVLSAGVSSRDGGKYLDFVMPIWVTHKSLVPAGEDKARLGWMRIGFGTDYIGDEVRKAALEGYGLIGLILALGLGMIGLSLWMVIPPIKNLAEAAKRIGKGDLETEVKVTTTDEIGSLGITFNQMSASLRQSRDRNTGLMERIGEAIQVVTSTTAQLLAVAEQQAGGASQQAEVIQEVASIASETSTTAARIAENAVSVSGFAAETSTTCGQGQTVMRTALDKVNELTARTQDAVAGVEELKARAQLIGGIIDLMEEIGEQIDLLALNAEIEAAGAGEQGRRFGIVANEVKRLAGQSLDSAESVRGLVADVRKTINRIVELIEREREVVEDSVQAVERMGSYFKDILSQVEATRDSSREIVLITRQQTSATEQVVDSIRNVSSVAREIHTGSLQIRQAMAELKGMAERLEEVARGKVI